jgi:hypothetical protein
MKTVLIIIVVIVIAIALLIWKVRSNHKNFRDTL